jgi:signal transduction histidine kinase
MTIRQLVSPISSEAKNSSADKKASALKPKERTRNRVESAIEASSSTIETRGAGGGLTLLGTLVLGIPEESVGRIFDDFYQVENPSQSPTKGTGLGLSISRKLADLLGGVLSVNSTPGAGSSFSLSIPVERLGIR